MGWSGLWNGVYNENHALTAHHLPPYAGGIIRVSMQHPGSFGHVGALGRNTVAARATTDHGGTLNVVGGYDYANRQNDPANRVDIPNAAQGDVQTNSPVQRVPNATETDMANVYDTTLNNHYVADGAGNGPATGGGMPGRTATS